MKSRSVSARLATLRYMLLGAFALSALSRVTALSSAPGTTPGRQFIELKKASSLPHDRLPVSFTSSWPTWVLDTSKDIENQWHKIPDTNGFVPPASIDELWQPIDLQYPSCRIAMGLHVRDGSIRHIFPALDLTLGSSGNLHRNRGLCSVPRAYQWMEFGSLAMGGGLEACSIVLQSRESDQPTWITHGRFRYINDVVNMAVEALADAPPKELGDGSSLIHVLCDADEVAHLSEIPRVGSDLRCLLIEEDGTTMGALEVKVAKTAAGSESEYLPEAYTVLFGDESLRRPAFVDMKRRMNQNDSNE
eukprot:scaffold7667_cov161-Amphora_coffeaeformis.AAC.5